MSYIVHHFSCLKFKQHSIFVVGISNSISCYWKSAVISQIEERRGSRFLGVNRDVVLLKAQWYALNCWLNSLPYPAYIFDDDGELITGNLKSKAPAPAYLGQIQYTSSQQEIVELAGCKKIFIYY